MYNNKRLNQLKIDITIIIKTHTHTHTHTQAQTDTSALFPLLVFRYVFTTTFYKIPTSIIRNFNQSVPKEKKLRKCLAQNI